MYILNTHLKDNKKIKVALQQVYGLGQKTVEKCCDSIGVSVEKRIKQLSQSEIERLLQYIQPTFKIGSECKRIRNQNIDRSIQIASYKGFRHSQGLPVRGQRTHCNAITSRKKNTKK